MSVAASLSPDGARRFPTPVRTILARLSGGPEDAGVLGHAGDLAAAFGAHVNCLHVPSEPPDMAELTGAPAFKGFGRRPDHDRDTRSAAARQAFNAWRQQRGWPVSGDPAAGVVTVGYGERDGDEATILAERARVADLVAIARPDALAALFVFDSLLSGGGRPLLMVPPHPARAMRGAVVAWNGSVQAARALGAGVPLLRALGGNVTVLCVAERDRQGSAADAVTYLRWHGIEAAIAEPTTEPVGAQLLALARDRDAGLLVSGAYSRSRLRQLLFGGVTGYLAEHADIPVLLAS
ncbi:MAG: universal stress protein [Bauldia sp.]|nr:universal stress protein [Bauldia sp.]